jgi:hypothetical protein
MKKVTLYKFKSDRIKVSMEIYFNEKDQLIFDGYDVGQTVKKLQGGYDYEYYYTIEMKEVQKIANLLKADPKDKSSILEVIKTNFSGNDAYSKFGDFMRARNIDFEPFTWRG